MTVRCIDCPINGSAAVIITRHRHLANNSRQRLRGVQRGVGEARGDEEKRAEHRDPRTESAELAQAISSAQLHLWPL